MEIQPLLIGIDIGGTKIAGGLIEPTSGQILVQRRIPTHAERGGMAVLNDTIALVQALMQDALIQKRPVTGIGLGICELVSPAGELTSAHTIDWRGLSIPAAFAQLAPTTIEADVRAHALAEARYGAGQDYRLFVFVTVGTGISSCLVQDGVPLAGARGNALVMASSPITFTCSVCGAVQRPILEEFASGPAILKRYNEIAPIPLQTTEDVMQAAQSGDQQAEQILGSAGAALGVSIAWLVNVLDPEAVIIGGGLGSVNGIYWEQMEASMREHIWADTSRDLPVRVAMLGPDAGMIGAACTLCG